MANNELDQTVLDIRKAFMEAGKELKSSIADFASIIEMFRHLGPEKTKEFLAGSSWDVTETGGLLSPDGTGLHATQQMFDQIKKVAQDVETIQRVTNKEYEEAVKYAKELYNEKLKNETIDAKTKAHLQAQVRDADLLLKSYQNIVKERQKSLELAEKEKNSLSTFLKESFGKGVGSASLGAFMGTRTDTGSISQFLLSKLGESSGLGKAFQDSQLAKALAKGFDLSDNARKITDNTTTSAQTDILERNSLLVPGSAIGKIGLNAALLGGLGLVGAHQLTGAGIRGVAHVVNDVNSMKQDPLGFYRSMGNLAGQLGGKVFGDKTGQLMSNMITQILDAVNFQYQYGLMSNIASQQLMREGGNGAKVSLLGMPNMSPGEAQGVWGRYIRQGFKFGSSAGAVGRNTMNLLGKERFYGEDVISEGFAAVHGNRVDPNQSLNQVVASFKLLEGISNKVNYSIHDMTKQINSAAKETRFLNVDMETVWATSSMILKNQTDLMLAGVDVKHGTGANVAALLGGHKKLPLAMQMYLNKDMEWSSTQQQIVGAMFNLGPKGLDQFDMSGPGGWSFKDKSLKPKDALARIQGMSGIYSSNMMMQQRDLFLNKIGGGNAESAFAKYMAGGKELSPYNEEQMKILLSKDFSKMNPKEIEEAMTKASKDPVDHLKSLVSSESVQIKQQAAVATILTGIAAALVMLPGYLRAIFKGTEPEQEAWSKAYGDVTKDMGAAWKTIAKNSASASKSGPLRHAFAMYRLSENYAYDRKHGFDTSNPTTRGVDANAPITKPFKKNNVVKELSAEKNQFIEDFLIAQREAERLQRDKKNSETPKTLIVHTHLHVKDKQLAEVVNEINISKEKFGVSGDK